MKSTVFLSHCSADKPFARRLAADLRAAGAKVWLDEAEIKLGESLIEKISIGLDQAEFMAVVLSPSSVTSPWVRRELEIALEREIYGRRVVVLPLLYRDCELPTFLRGKLYADFRDDASYASSLQLLTERIGLPSVTTLSDSLERDAASFEEMSSARSDLAARGEAIRRRLFDAQVAFRDGMYGPFWDAIEQTTVDLAACLSDIDRIIGALHEAVRSGLSHSAFRQLTRESADIPDLQEAVDELTSLSQRAQAHFNFAVIWEHRRSRKVIAEGFTTVGDAVTGLSTAIREAQNKLGSIRRKIDANST